MFNQNKWEIYILDGGEFPQLDLPQVELPQL